MSPLEEKESVLSKITALLAQAESTTFEAEAEAFAAKAEELMIRHAIDRDLLAGFRGKKRDDQIIQVRTVHTGIFRSAERYMTNRIGTAFGFQVLQLNISWENKDCAIWVGFESDIREAELIAASLHLQVYRAMTNQVKTWKTYGYGKQDLYVARRSFIQAFGERVGKRIKETRGRVEAEVAADVGENKLLPVLLDKSRQIDEAFGQMFPNTRRGRSSSQRFDGLAGAAGRNAADRADVGSPRIGSRGAIER